MLEDDKPVSDEAIVDHKAVQSEFNEGASALQQ